MPSPYDSPPDSADPFILDSSSQLSYAPRCEPDILSDPKDDREDDFLKPYIVVFRLNPFTTHDGIHGRPVPASARAHSHPEDMQPITLEFQLSLGSPPSPTPESESNSEGDPASKSPPPDSDASIRPGTLRYLDGETAPSPVFAEPPRTQFETTTWSPAPLFHPLPQPARQSFSQLDNTHRSPATFHAHPHFNDQDHPFTRVDRTPEPKASYQQSSTLTYPPSLAYYAHHTGSESGSMYAPQSTVEEGQESSSGYRYEYSSSHTSGSDGYPATHAHAGSYSYSQDDNPTYSSQAQQSFSFSFARGDASSRDTLFATPAQMSIPSRQEEIYPLAHDNPNPSPMPYPGGDFTSTNGHPLGHAAPPSLNIVADDHYGLSNTRLHDGNRRDAPLPQNDAQVRDIKFSSSSPHQTQPGLIRRLPPPVSYDSREPYFQTSPRGYDQIASRGYGQGANGFEQPASEPQYHSRPPSIVFDRRRSLTFERSVSRTSSGVFSRPTSDAFSHISSGTLDLADSGSGSPYLSASHVPERPCSGLLDQSASHVPEPFARRASFDSVQTPGTITPMRIFDSPAPMRSDTIPPALSTTSFPVDRRSASRTPHPFPPFQPGEMNRSGGKKHWCTVCNRGFARPSTLATHLNSHTGEQPHLCPIKSCGSRFSVSSNLKRHVKRHNLSGLGPVPRAQRKKTTAARKGSEKRRPRVLQERKNVQPWCPESLRGMRNAKSLSSRPPFEMLERTAPLRAPLPAVRPHGQLGDENYEDRDSFFYARETDQPIPYHPLVWELHPTLPGPLPSHADREARVRSAYGYGGTLSGLGA